MSLMIGVTGSIATGKSSVCSILEQLGALHTNADTLVHQLYAPGTPGFDRVVAEFGREVVGPDGVIDRRILGSKVFGNPEAMSRLTRAMGSIEELVFRTMQEMRDALGADGTGVLEAVNLIEPGYSGRCDQTWLVVVDDDTARARLIARNGFSETEANQRLASQRDWKLRAPAADFILHNTGTPEEMENAVRAEFDRIWALKRAGQLPVSNYVAWREANPQVNRYT
ncbi:MAG: dephospho-CoA kinase [Dehalococcoidia bacterium]